MKGYRLILVISLALLLSGCWPFGKKRPQVTAPPRPNPSVKLEPPPTTVPPKQVPEEPTAAATIDPNAPLPPPPPAEQTPVKPPKRTPRTRPPSAARGSAKKPPAVSAPAVVESAPPQQPAPAGKLGEILTDEQKTEYRRGFQQSDTAARQILANLAGRQLSTEQQDVLARINSFLQQAAEASATDWSLAAQLARRAELLARDLANTIK